MNKQPIIIKRIYDEEGGFKYLQLTQGDNTIDLNLEPKSPHHVSYKWEELKLQVEKHVKDIREQTQGEAIEGKDFYFSIYNPEAVLNEKANTKRT